MCLRDLANKMIGETNYRARQSFAVLVDEIAPNLQPVKFMTGHSVELRNVPTLQSNLSKTISLFQKER